MRGALIAGLLTVCLAPRSFAQPQAQPAAPSEPDFALATDLYNTATQQMADGRYEDAARNFLAAFDITKDPVLFFKIGTAFEKAGKCGDALTAYQRYLTEAKPAENFVALTRDRIDACRAALAPTTPAPAPEAAPPATEPAPAPAPAADIPLPITQPSRNTDRAWLFVGGSLAFATAGAVLAYAVSSSEQDVKDLYISNGGMPPNFDAKTKKRYDDLVAEGNRYQALAWTSFSLAAGCAVGATIFFLRARGDVTVAPIVTPKETGVSAMLRF